MEFIIEDLRNYDLAAQNGGPSMMIDHRVDVENLEF
jgi:hypothetical protein